MSKKLNKKGFTLIEVVLVLAIGGLIFLLAFIAYQQVSRNRRDTQRRNDAGRILAQIETADGDGMVVSSQGVLTGNSAGATTAASGANFLRSNFSGSLKGPDDLYKWTYSTTASPSVAQDNIYVRYHATCNGSGAFTDGSTGYAVIIGLENGSICRSSS